jgi:hypothetical protein
MGFVLNTKKGRTMMKSWLWTGILAAALALPAASGVARAQSTDNDGCSDATLKGDYAFVVTALTNQTFVVGIGRFDGKGGFTQIDYPADGLLAVPPLTDFRMGQTGTYAVRADCTGTQVINLNVGGMGPLGGVINNVFVISDGGRAIHGVVAGSSPPGKTTLVPGITRVDFWKVASERDN